MSAKDQGCSAVYEVHQRRRGLSRVEVKPAGLMGRISVSKYSVEGSGLPKDYDALSDW